ncbi:S-formylglutathione hydrolase [Paraburkholderia aspalathi]|uniref:S-formylglutathione hydrolase n=1 Tax=Paraburkholderia aspalathi TaxID=1324617 RepID=UPI001B02A37E|nr:S-formylglutathione hydrolase [Paraburkholderia aspalathi]CAE6859103.1 S-formylglutathione hydrolase [Paraburkholderia aspalathi]
MSLDLISSHRCFDGTQRVYSHKSDTLQCDMRFGVFLPPAASIHPVPTLFWLSGLTCTEQNFLTKAGAQRASSALGIALIVPDTSPRGPGIPDDEAYDFGMGAGFYVDATRAPWSTNYRMYSYIVDELRTLVAAQFPVDPARFGISGHSMGGHGALTIALRNPSLFRTVSAFSPICAPMQCPWGEKALTGYLGDDRTQWSKYDAAQLMLEDGWAGPQILVDQGDADEFLTTQLKPDLLVEAAARGDVPLNLRRRAGYDHSYFFISTFIASHLEHHACHLAA